MAKKRAIVVGGDAAGMSAASQMKRVNPDLEVVVFEKGAHISYGACGMPYYIAGEIADSDALLALKPEDFAARGIEVRTGCEVTQIRSGSRSVEVVAAGSVSAERYDFLVLATGGTPRRPELDGVALEGVFTLRTLQDGIDLRSYLDRQRPGKAAIIGTGFIGMEMVEAFLKRGVQVVLFGRSDHILTSFDSIFAAPLLDDLRRRKVEFVTGYSVRGLVGEGGQVRSVATERGAWDVDLVLLAAGLLPGSGLARSAGIACGSSGGIVVDDRMKTNIPGIYAAGDCIETHHVVSGKQVFSPLALTANRTGRIAGDNIGAQSLGQISPQRFKGTVGTMVAKVCDFTLAQTGLTEQEAVEAGFVPAVFARQSHSRAAYYPGGSAISTRIVVDRRTRRLLGAQMLGQEGVAGRIDVFATALFNRMTVEEIYNLDLAYAPPYGPVYDPIIEICGRANLEL